jgi:hypothetical protein
MSELKKPAALQFRHNNSDGFVAGYEKEEMDKFLSEVAAVLAERGKDALNTMKKFNDWNDASNTKIPLNEEIFALLEDRMDPEKLRPAVIVAKMHPAKSLTWTENKEGDALCYDLPVGNFHCCNGAEIKYWKAVNIPSEPAVGMIDEKTRDKYAQQAANERCRCFKCDGIRNDTHEKCGPKPCNTCMEWHTAYWAARLALEMYGRDVTGVEPITRG